MTPQNILTSLGELRDGLLVLISVVYILGFTVWSVFAWQHGLGPLPVLDAQYLTAGFPAFVVVSLVALLAYLSRRLLLVQWPKWLASQSKAKQRLVYGLLVTALIFSFLWLILAEYLLELPAEFDKRLLIALPSFIIIFLVGLFLQPRLLYENWLQSMVAREWMSEEDAASLREHWGWKLLPSRPQLSNVYLLLTALGALGIFFWSSTLYERVPQELGGAKPRCATLDVIWTDFSAETLHELGASVPVAEAKEVVSTQEVLLFYASKTSIIVSPDGLKDSKVELTRDAVTALRWCSEEPGK